MDEEEKDEGGFFFYHLLINCGYQLGKSNHFLPICLKSSAGAIHWRDLWGSEDQAGFRKSYWELKWDHCNANICISVWNAYRKIIRLYTITLTLQNTLKNPVYIKKKNLWKPSALWLVDRWTCDHVQPFYSKLVSVSALVLWAFAWPPAPSMLWNM